ncbi:MAG: hypothetical protein ABI876_13695, partial [Bacteroidota bacterium]
MESGTNRRADGAIHEQIALEYLLGLGYTLVGRNFHFGRAGEIETVQSDLLSGVEGEIDLVISNPPYLVDAEARVYRHGGGSFGEGLAVRIVSESLGRLAKGGKLVLYTGTAVVQGRDTFLEHCRPLLEDRGASWSYREIDPDVFG